jgi:hypothetical protein
MYFIEPKIAIAKGAMIDAPDTARSGNVIVQLKMPKEKKRS